jgi:hypothetical protein
MNRHRWKGTRISNLVQCLLNGHRVNWRCVEANYLREEDRWQVTIEVGLPMLPHQYRHLLDLASRWHFDVRVWTAQEGAAVLPEVG